MFDNFDVGVMSKQFLHCSDRLVPGFVGEGFPEDRQTEGSMVDRSTTSEACQAAPAALRRKVWFWEKSSQAERFLCMRHSLREAAKA